VLVDEHVSVTDAPPQANTGTLDRVDLNEGRAILLDAQQVEAMADEGLLQFFARRAGPFEVGDLLEMSLLENGGSNSGKRCCAARICRRLTISHSTIDASSLRRQRMRPRPLW
jgi:hypothetical protein